MVGLTVIAWSIWGSNSVVWAVLVFSTYLILATQFHLYRSTQNNLEHQQQKVQAYFSLYSLISFRASLPYMTGWAATPEHALIIFEEIKNNKPQHLLELGSGVSTIIAAYGLEQNSSGSILSLDHDSGYAEKTTKQLQVHRLDEIAEVKYAPLATHNLVGKNWKWYDLNAVTLPEKIDMLLVDGPPVKTNKNARYPALPMLIDRMSDNAVIILHDAHRPNEVEIIKTWKKQFPVFDCDVINIEKGVAILRKQ